jgi:anti-sigma28 factor (negative regulator of flagellin synthesis)
MSKQITWAGVSGEKTWLKFGNPNNETTFELNEIVEINKVKYIVTKIEYGTYKMEKYRD